MGGGDAEEYLRVLHEIALNERESTRCRIQAIQLLLARGWGAEPQVVDIAVQQTISASEIRRLLDAENILDDPVGSVSADSEATSDKRVIAWLNGDWPPPRSRGGPD